MGLLAVVFGLSLTLGFPHPLAAADLVTGPVNKAEFQVIVDLIDDGDRIVALPGVYDFATPGPVLLTRSVEIVAADSSNPPIFQGSVDTNGRPVQIGLPLDGNTAFAVPGGTNASGIRLQGLHLTGFNRAVVVYDGFDDRQPGCPTSPARLSDFWFTDNTITHSNRGFQAVGGPHSGLIIRNNNISVNGIAVLLLGQVSCLDPSGGWRFVDDTPRIFGTDLSNNVVSGRFGVLAVHTREARIEGNGIEATQTGITLANDSSDGENGVVLIAHVARNLIVADFLGISVEQLGGTESRTLAYLRDNAVEESRFGIYLARGANGVKVARTSFSAIELLEVFIDEGAYDNQLTLKHGERVEDLGDRNKVRFK